jgi:hypothetical protein
MINLERFRAKNIERDERIKAEKKVAKREARWAAVLFKEMAAACKATRTQQAFVWVWLQHLAWRADYKPFHIPSNGLEVYGISRKTKMRALAAYEKAGLISVTRRNTKAPIVTMLARVWKPSR